MYRDGSGDAGPAPIPRPQGPAERAQVLQYGLERETGTIFRISGPRLSFVICATYLLYESMVFLILLSFSFLFMQVWNLFSTFGLDFYQDSACYLRTLYLLVVIKAFHHYMDQEYLFVQQLYTLRFLSSTFYNYLPSVFSFGCLLVSYGRLLHEFFTMKKNLEAGHSVVYNTIPYVISVFYINYHNVTRCIKDSENKTFISNLILRYGAFTFVLLLLSHFCWLEYQDAEDQSVTTPLPFIDYFAVVSALTFAIHFTCLTTTAYFLPDFELRAGNKVQELFWTVCSSHVLIHCYFEAQAGIEPQLPEGLSDLRFYTALFFSGLVTGAVAIG